MTPSALFFPPLMKKLALIDLTERLSPRSRAWLAHSWGSAAARHTVMEQGAVTPEQGREGTLPPFSLALIGTRSSNAPRKMCPIMVLFCRVQIRQKTSGHREVLIKKKKSKCCQWFGVQPFTSCEAALSRPHCLQNGVGERS